MAEVTPKPAATVTLVRDTGSGIEVLMMERNLSASFAPGAYVFPGGALDPVDHTPEMQMLCSGISDAQASRVLGIAQGGLAYWAAAICESFEEAGLLIAYDAGQRVIALDDTEVIERFRRHRHALNQGTHSLLDILRDQRLTLAADQLAYFGHRITPASSPRRFDTRFFVAAAPPAQVPSHDNQEIISHVWITPGQALDRHRRDDFKMSFPTIRALEEFSAYDTAASLMRAMYAKHEIPAILPHISRQVAGLLPGEPGYEEIASCELRGEWKA